MRAFFDTLEIKSTISALDVAMGSGRVSMDLLVHLYDNVDGFDCSTNSVKEMLEHKKLYARLGDISLSTMEKFPWKNDYSGIWMSWCIGYPKENDLIEFLKKAKLHLYAPLGSATRNTRHGSYIFVLETVLQGDGGEFYDNGHLVMKQATIEGIFDKAGLKIVDSTPPTVVHENFRPVMVWALQ